MKPNRTNQNKSRDIGFIVLLAVLIIATIFTVNNTEEVEKTKYSEIVDYFEQEKVQKFTAEDTKLTLTLRPELGEEEGKTVTYDLYSFSLFYNDLSDLIREQHDKGIIEEYDINEGFVAPWWLSFVPYLIIMIIFMALWYSMMNRAGGAAGGVMKFSKARTRTNSDGKDKKTFNDVAGCEEEKQELAEIVDFLKDPKRYTQMGARIPKGVLLVGPPGTGKTLLAKAVAGEANVPFLSISGSDFVELYVGVGAGRVRDLFEQAKKAAPAIIFIDEIDAVGRQRGSGLGGGHDEREQTLNQLLVEMDGFGTNEGVIVMAATNRADILDNALLRPGRFDRQVYVDLPDIRGREAILKIHARDKKLAEDVDLNSIAKGTPGFSGADLENLMNEASILAVRRNHRFIAMEDIDEAILKVQMGPEKKTRKMSEKARKLTAYHEAGHAVTGRYLEHADPVHYITIIPRGRAGGFTLFRPNEDLENFRSKSELIARDMVMKYGFSEKLGTISYDDSGHSIFIGRDFGQTKSYSEETAALIDEEVKAIFEEATKKCEQILTEHADQLKDIAEYLLIHETMDADEFNYYFEHGEFMPEPMRLAKNVKNDPTIERPARKISMTEGAEGKEIAETAENTESEKTTETPKPEEQKTPEE